MITPYDWQEGIGHRAEYVQSRLEGGSPVLAVSIPEGVLTFTVRRQAKKIFEIYDRLLMAGLGQQSDVESLRVAAIDFAHQEGYQRSEADVTVQRVVGVLSTPLKRAFSDFNSSPFVLKAMFAEVGAKPESDLFFVLDFDGDYHERQQWAVLSGEPGLTETLRDGLATLYDTKPSLDAAMNTLKDLWAVAMSEDGGTTYAELTRELTSEAVLLERNDSRQTRFRVV